MIMYTKNINRLFTTTLLSVLLSAVSAQEFKAPAKLPAPQSKGYAPVNDIKMYYEVYGAGKPIVLVHGSYMTIPLNFSELIPILSKTNKVIAVELQGHGRTADTERLFSYDMLADDIAGLLDHLRLDSAILLGYSFGATIVLNTAMRHPEKVTKLVFISSTFKHDGWTPDVRQILKMIVPEFFENTPLKTYYDSLAPNPANWKSFVKKLAAFDTTYFDLGKTNVGKIKCPVLIIKADNDGVDLHHTAEMYSALGGNISADMVPQPKSQLVVIPNKAHVTLMMDTAELMRYIGPFVRQ